MTGIVNIQGIYTSVAQFPFSCANVRTLPPCLLGSSSWSFSLSNNFIIESGKGSWFLKKTAYTFVNLLILMKTILNIANATGSDISLFCFRIPVGEKALTISKNNFYFYFVDMLDRLNSSVWDLLTKTYNSSLLIRTYSWFFFFLQNITKNPLLGLIPFWLEIIKILSSQDWSYHARFRQNVIHFIAVPLYFHMYI